MIAATSDRPWLKAYPEGVPADVDASQYPSLVALMEESFKKNSSRVAYSFMGKDISFGQTDSLSVAFGVYLQGLGMSTGDRVALLMPHVPQHPVTVAALLRAGLRGVPVTPIHLPAHPRPAHPTPEANGGAARSSGGWGAGGGGAPPRQQRQRATMSGGTRGDAGAGCPNCLLMIPMSTPSDCSWAAWACP